jgi:hypothetical protein
MADRDRILELARGQLGEPYVWGAESPSEGFDCSGLVQWVFKEAGVSLPRTARTQQDAVTRITADEAQPGDLVFWGDPAHHVGIYIGNGRVLDAPHTGAVVQERKLWGSPTFGRPRGLLDKLKGAVTDPLGAASSARDAAGAAIAQGVQAAAGQLVEGAKPLLVKGVFALLAVGLVGAGLYQSTKGGR